MIPEITSITTVTETATLTLFDFCSTGEEELISQAEIPSEGPSIYLHTPKISYVALEPGIPSQPVKIQGKFRMNTWAIRTGRWRHAFVVPISRACLKCVLGDERTLIQ